MARWLMKSEPDVFGWRHQLALGAKGDQWHGIRNYQARNNMRLMTLGDQAFFYHTGNEKAVVGIMEVCGPLHQDTTTDDPRWDCVDMRSVRPFARPVTLAEIRARPELGDMVLVRNSRLSVQPVTDAEWATVCAMGGIDP